MSKKNKEKSIAEQMVPTKKSKGFRRLLDRVFPNRVARRRVERHEQLLEAAIQGIVMISQQQNELIQRMFIVPANAPQNVVPIRQPPVRIAAPTPEQIDQIAQEIIAADDDDDEDPAPEPPPPPKASSRRSSTGRAKKVAKPEKLPVATSARQVYDSAGNVVARRIIPPRE